MESSTNRGEKRNEMTALVDALRRALLEKDQERISGIILYVISQMTLGIDLSHPSLFTEMVKVTSYCLFSLNVNSAPIQETLYKRRWCICICATMHLFIQT